MNLKPVLTIQGDKLDVHTKARGMKQAEAKMIEAVRQDRLTRFGDVPDSQLRVETAGTFESEEQAQRWRGWCRRNFPRSRYPMCSCLAALPATWGSMPPARGS